MPALRRAHSVNGLMNHDLSLLTSQSTRSNIGYRPSYLNMVDESNHDEIELNTVDITQKIEGRKKRVILGYKISSVMYAIFGMFIFRLSKKPFYASGPLLASGLSYILIGATENNRLASDTYKKVNIVMAKYGLFGLASGMLMSLSPAWNISCVITMINSTKGYGYGLKGWELKEASAKDDIVSMMKETVTNMTKADSLKSKSYLMASIVMHLVTVRKFLEIVNLIVSKSNGNMIGTSIFRFTKYMLFTLLMTLLKSASDRNRLEGTTFIQMNMIAAVGFASWVAYLVTEYGKLTQFGALMAACSIFTGTNGIVSMIQKTKPKTQQ